jgi:hypothetical protein
LVYFPVCFLKKPKECPVAFAREVYSILIWWTKSSIFVYFNSKYSSEGNSNSSINSSQSVQSIDQKMTLVFFIGGCTYAEVSAFRYLSESNESTILFWLYPSKLSIFYDYFYLKQDTSEFIVATTSLVNGKNILSILQEVASWSTG